MQLPIRVLLVCADISKAGKDEVLKGRCSQSTDVQVSPRSSFTLAC